MRIDIDVAMVKTPRPLAEIDSLSKAIQSSLCFDSLRDSVSFVCMWDEYRRTGTITGESCYGTVVTELLQIYGIDINKIKRA